jgi:hypothetical protein
MKSFYSSAAEAGDSFVAGSVSSIPTSAASVALTPLRVRARIAVYESLAAAPRVEEVGPRETAEFIETLSSRVHELAVSLGGSVPYTVVREVAENFIHAGFAEPVVSILDGGATIRFADQGPGIRDKEKALLPGFTTATAGMKRHIRGVGSGLPIVREYLVHSGGSLAIEDNLGCGSVVTVCSCSGAAASAVPPVAGSRSGTRSIEWNTASVPLASSEQADLVSTTSPRLTTRQKQVLALVLETGLAGPSLVAKELGVGISTAYRDLASLEEAGLITADSGKRTLSAAGLSYLGDLTHRY